MGESLDTGKLEREAKSTYRDVAEFPEKEGDEHVDNR